MSVDNQEREYFLSSSTNVMVLTDSDTRHEDRTSPSTRYGIQFRTTTKWKVSSKNFLRRIPKSKVVFYTIIINVIQSLSFYVVVQSIVDAILQMSHQKKSHLIAGLVFGIQNGFPALFYPIGGILGDVYLGRHFISLLCMFIAFFSYSVLSFALALAYNVSEAGITTGFGVVVPLIALLLITASDGIFQINWLTFGADQLINSPSEEVSSYIYWWSWGKNLGFVLAVSINAAIAPLSILPFSYPFMKNVVPSIISFLSAVMIATAIFIDKSARKLYDRERINKDPVKQIFGVLHNAFTSKPKASAFTSAFRYGEDLPSGLDFAREYHDGKYTDEEVEDVKSCGRIFIMIVIISGYNAIYCSFGYKVVSDFQAILSRGESENTILESMFTCILNSSTSLIESMLILVLLPLWNHVILPFMGHYSPNTRKRIGIGTFFGVLGSLLAAVLYTQNKGSIYLLIPFFLNIVAESLVLVSALEFIYAQSPDNMKGILMGSNYFLIGIWSIISEVLLFYVPEFNEHSSLYYFCFAGIGFVGLVLFTVTSCCYKNRMRNNPISDIARITSYY